MTKRDRDLEELRDRLHQLPTVTAYQGESLRQALAAVDELEAAREIVRAAQLLSNTELKVDPGWRYLSRLEWLRQTLDDAGKGETR